MISPNGTFSCENVRGSLHIEANGSLVASTVQDQKQFLLDALNGSPSEVVLSLVKTEQVDSLGIILIMGLYKSCNSSHIPFKVEGVGPSMMRVFQLFSLQKLFPVTARAVSV